MKLSLSKLVNQQTKQPLVETSELIKLIKWAYVYLLRTGKHKDWSSFAEHLDKLAFQDKDLKDPVIFDNALANSLRLRGRTNQWFHKNYLTFTGKPYSDLSMEMGISKSIVSGQYDLVLVDNQKVIALEIGENPIPERGTYDSLEQRTKAYLLYRTIGYLPNSIQYLTVPANSESQLELREFRITSTSSKSFTEATYRSILHIVQGIENRVYYPAVSEQCQPCEFRSICKFQED